jgi:hypothetical protein
LNRGIVTVESEKKIGKIEGIETNQSIQTFKSLEEDNPNTQSPYKNHPNNNFKQNLNLESASSNPFKKNYENNFINEVNQKSNKNYNNILNSFGSGKGKSNIKNEIKEKNKFQQFKKALDLNDKDKKRIIKINKNKNSKNIYFDKDNDSDW